MQAFINTKCYLHTAFCTHSLLSYLTPPIIMSKLNNASADSNSDPESVWYSCNCHCGATSFRISHEPLEDTSLSKAAPLAACNCSICSKNGYLLMYVFRTDIEFIRGWEDLRNYRFASKTRDHKFCGVCGTSIGIDFMGSNKKGDIIAINVSCLVYEHVYTEYSSALEEKRRKYCYD